MLTISVVHGHADSGPARELGDYLERNCAVDLDYAVVRGDLLAVAGRALAADVTILMLSPHSVPRRLERDEWEPLFARARAEQGTELAFVPLAECPFPKVLLRSNTFPPSPNLLAGARGIKRWLFELRPPAERGSFVRPGKTAALTAGTLEALWVEFADRPGRGTLSDSAVARAFAEQAQNDFEGVFWVDCRGCSRAEAAGELALQLGVRLAGNVDSNLDALRSICQRHRCLLVLEGASEEVAAAFDQTGRTSVIAIHPGDPLPPMDSESARSRRQALAAWMARSAARPGPGEIRRTLAWLIDTSADWDAACEFARAAVAFHKFHERSAEAFELLEMILYAAMERRDAASARDFGREQAWILESWGVEVGRRSAHLHAGAEPRQLELFA